MPFITVDEVDGILDRKAAEEQDRMVDMRDELEELKREKAANSNEQTDNKTEV